MDKIKIFEIKKNNDPLLAQIEPLFVKFYKYMEGTGLNFPLPSGGEKIWLDAIKKTLNRFSKLIVATQDDKVIGFIHGIVRLTPAYLGSKKVGFMNGMYVSPEYRSKGIASRMAKKLEAWYVEEKVHSIEGEVLIQSEGVVKFWRKQEFEQKIVKIQKVLGGQK